jgi:competence protein ComGC
MTASRKKQLFARMSSFTLMELLIVILIVPIATLALYCLLDVLCVAKERSWRRMNAMEAGTQMLASWRDDVRLAEKVFLDVEGKTMTVSRFDREGRTVVVRYAATAEGGLARVIEEGRMSGQPATRTFCRCAAELEFQQTGSGYRIGWTIEEWDGAQTWRWPQAGYATPLAPAQEDDR